MILIIAGGRDYELRDGDFLLLDAIPDVSEVVSGGCRGADLVGEQWAKERGIPIKKFPADWSAHGKSAGPIRNALMAKYADALFLFPGGRGSASMLKEAKNNNLIIFFKENIIDR